MDDESAHVTVAATPADNGARLARILGDELTRTLEKLSSEATRAAPAIERSALYTMMVVGISMLAASFGLAAAHSFGAREFMVGTLTGAAVLSLAGALTVVEAVTARQRTAAELSATTDAVKTVATGTLNTLFPLRGPQ